jgi:hypothetical protein
MTGKRDLLFVGNVLVAEDQHDHHRRRYRAETDDGLGVRGIRFNLVQDGATTPEIIEPLSKQVNDSHSSRFIIKLDDSIWTLTTSRISRPDIGCETRRLANPRFSTHRDRPARAFSKLIFFREVDHSSPEGPRVSSQQISTSRLRGIEGSNPPFPTGESCRRSAGYRPAASRRRRAARICFTSEFCGGGRSGSLITPWGNPQ